MHILIADDYAETAASLADLLEILAPAGTTTCFATDGLQALDKARDKRPDIVVLDMAMPKMSGIEAGHQLRQLYGGGLVLVALSAQAEHLAAARISGDFDHTLSKPVNVEKLPSHRSTMD